jgi:hypothetical protein
VDRQGPAGQPVCPRWATTGPALARRRVDLDEEIKEVHRAVTELTEQAAPELLERPGVGVRILGTTAPTAVQGRRRESGRQRALHDRAGAVRPCCLLREC